MARPCKAAAILPIIRYMRQQDNIGRKSNSRTRYIIKTSVVGIAGNVFLTVIKVLVGIAAGSVAIVLDALNSLTDAVSSIVTIIGTKIATMRPTRKHPLGYGRVEYITSILISMIILVAGVLSLYESVLRIIHPVEPDYRIVTLLVLIAAIIVKVVLWWVFVRRGRRINSQPLVASGIDALYDAILTGGTLFAALICMIWHIDIDGWVGVVISAFILKAGIDILKDAINPIVGERPNPTLVEDLREEIVAHKEVRGVYDMFLDDFGPEITFAAAHIEVDDDMTASQIHPLTRDIAEDIYKKHNVIITLGIYATSSSKEYAPIRQYLEEEIKGHPEILQMHAFYVEREKKRVDFDLVIDFSADPGEVTAHVAEMLKKKFPDYRFNVVADVDYSLD